MLVVWTAEGSAARLVAELPVDSVTGVRVHLSESVVVQRCDAMCGAAATTGRSLGKQGDEVVLDLFGYVLV